MPQLIKGDAVVEDSWSVVEKGDEFPAKRISDGEQLLLPLSMWLQHTDQVNHASIGVWLDSDEEPTPLAERCNTLQVIAINFPAFADGRGYSYARQLRDYYGYEGELRAIGEVLRDQLYFYRRCGFDAFAIAEGRSAEDSLDSLKDFSVVYQATNDGAVPAFRKR